MNMIKRIQLFPLNFYKKSNFTGSDGKMNFRLGKEEVENGEEKEVILKGYVWEGPFCFDVTSKEKMEGKEFPFSEEGICQALAWLNQKSTEF